MQFSFLTVSCVMCERAVCFCALQSKPFCVFFFSRHFRTIRLCTSPSCVRRLWDAPCLLLLRRSPASVSHPSSYRRSASTDPAGPWAESCSTLCLSWPSSIRIGKQPLLQPHCIVPAAQRRKESGFFCYFCCCLYSDLDKRILKHSPLLFIYICPVFFVQSGLSLRNRRSPVFHVLS